MTDVEVVEVGERACLVEVEDAVAAASLATWLRGSGLRAEEVVPAARSVLVDGADPAAVRELLPRWTAHGAPPPGSVVRVEVRYTGPDLARVADHWGCTPEEVVDLHTSLEFTSTFCGFAPGFAYLSWGDPRLAVPRRREPRTSVPSGAVGLAGEFSAIYPRSSPGGWQLIGRTDVVVFDIAGDPPALLQPNMAVRFVDVSGAGDGD